MLQALSFLGLCTRVAISHCIHCEVTRIVSLDFAVYLWSRLDKETFEHGPVTIAQDSRHVADLKASGMCTKIQLVTSCCADAEIIDMCITYMQPYRSRPGLIASVASNLAGPHISLSLQV